ncbi:DUF1800 domain-containing protein [Acuticoccus sp. MNP-M23]|uniref:DUF1800 domain-containing protein n=1 Tax=Acuticoccus sp. MNP-M23 TaxID=3072793 RepID=UPI002814A2F0|nr:DUF1800 domain-containing protein [Acuticoccus sp. MNP-M23]WMS41452.1 DUF1800 domain-containing protein [Acuticoccus sp. MNP-M23]
MMMRPRALTALTRFGLGPRPGEMKAIGDDPAGYLRDQLQDPGVAIVTDPILYDRTSLRKRYMVVRTAYREARKALRDGATEAEIAAEEAARMGNRALVKSVVDPEVEARFNHAVATNAAFVERLVMFWSNHFAIEAKSGFPVRLTVGNFEREAIRPHVLGYFEDMVAAATTHPAMLYYLDNARSVGPNSQRGRRRGVASANENLARELMELHTLGAGGGYTQEDVVELAKAMTGWLGGFHPSGNGLIYEERVHEPGYRTVLGKTYGAGGQTQLEEIIPDLALHPSTARHIATKFARHFVADGAPDALIEKLRTTFLDTGGDLRAMTLALIDSDVAWDSAPKKTVPPYDFMIAAARATGSTLPGPFIRRSARDLAQQVWMPPSPAGWPSDDNAFLGGDAMLERVDFARQIARRFSTAGRADELAIKLFGDALDPFVEEAVDRAEDQSQGLVLLLMSPPFHRR